MEISDTRSDRPQVGRAWFEAAVRDTSRSGDPTRSASSSGARCEHTPGRFATNVITRGVYPRIEIRDSAGAKAYFKHEQALR